MQVWSELGRSAGTKDGNPFLFFHLENPMHWEYTMVTVCVRQDCSDLTHEISLERFIIYIYIYIYIWIYYTCSFHTLPVTCSTTTTTNSSLAHFISVTEPCPALCGPMNRTSPGFPVYHQLPEFTKTYVHWDDDAIQPSHPLSFPSRSDPNPSHHQRFLWVNTSCEVANVLEFQL